MSRRLFGTDGVRGIAGELLSAELALALGRAVTHQLDAARPQVLLVRDTRESGPMLEAALAAGVSAAGGDVLLGGVLPTPAAPLLIARYDFDLAAVISASHNPYRDNGIKFFGGDGYKLSDELELSIERELEGAPARSTQIGRIRELRGAGEDYLRELHTRFQALDLAGLDLVIDCANGATSEVAPEIFGRLGAEVTVLANLPDGRNINDGCGSTHMQVLAERVREGGHTLGFAFDGDGDRVLAVDGAGDVVDGDELIALAALHLRDAGRLHGDGVVVTVMTNYGFHTAMARRGDRGCEHEGGGQVRAGGAAGTPLDARRRAVRPPDRAGVQPHRRRDRGRAAHARGARRIGPARAQCDGAASPAPRERPGA